MIKSRVDFHIKRTGARLGTSMSAYLCAVLEFVSLRGKNKGTTNKKGSWYLLAILFKISDNHPGLQSSERNDCEDIGFGMAAFY